MLAERYMANPDISCRPEVDGAALFNPDTEDSVAVNTVGHLIWLALARPRAPQELVTHLLATCQGAPAEQVTADVAGFLQALQPRGFVGQVLAGDGPLPALTPAQPGPARSAPAEEDGSPARPRFYHGRSMAGTFRPGDALASEAVPMAAIRRGDVVVYRGHSPTGTPTDVVHRVVAVVPGGLVTQGDNNSRVDGDLVTAEVLVGRVTHRARGGRTRRVRGGPWGLRQVQVRRAWCRARSAGWRLLRAVGRPVYGWLRASGLIAWLWRPAITRLLLTGSDGVQVKYIRGRRTVARWRPATGSWSCRRPYDLILLRPNGRDGS